MSDNWGPRYGDPTHPTTGELPRVGDGRGTDELKTVQVDTVDGSVPPMREPSRPRYSWENPDHGRTEPSAPREESGWSVPRAGRDGSPSSDTQANRFRYSWETSQPRMEPSRPRADDTTQFARVGDGMRGAVGPVTVQVDHVRIDGGVRSDDTQLLPTSAFMRPKPEEIPEAVESPRPEPGTGSMPAMRHQIGPDWTQTPLRLLAAAVVATAVLGASAASLITIGNWINP
ncbi:hypothetical protein SAMN05216298_4129 [Glycomyces sambucus]|uniref:Uncharacterized protein n=1 Tax=Glycomyces sambucus TaxID=380244 RepID=A0A1G9KL72_9ACTN|nr:hypothetical protein [Glycomyces sambucus]SDL50471.1 hypothetical protein SAMN05216298_4129 [Glycomyces sambucus]